jgi:predicted DNA-binding mobile mystery protein A
MKNQWLTIKQLDRQLKEWQMLNHKYNKPGAGWIKTLRLALSMSAEQFADRLGLKRGRINQLENAEVHDAVTLRALKEAANALECELVYAIVPKGNATLEDIIKDRAKQIADEQVGRVAHSMSLESQTIDADTLKIQKDELSRSLAEHLNKKFWATERSNKQNNLRQKLVDTLKKKK